MARKPSKADDNGAASAAADTKSDSKPASRTRSRSGGRSGGRGSRTTAQIETGGGEAPPASRMIVNYTPGDECRIAFVEDGKLEEYHAESTQSVSRVNNIYLGVVRNVNTAVQAAFVDFGLDEHGFLHTTDVHPKFFPDNGDGSERVGKKTPRRERPPIQKCFKPGDRIMVQVLKEGVGTKGPTLTSYISIPGRYLVMMPGMDNVGVSRKVEDEDQRRAMRKVLDQLDLPEGFGFILRTAGMEATKTELKRDLAYLKRLWSDMEGRQKGGRAPVALYAESDLLLRALRDLAGSGVEEILIDDAGALARAERFLKIVSPRNRPSLKRLTAVTPIFSAFGIEAQVQNINAREVPLPSGGRLVIDETEALVAIDVNSGRSRKARDAETNAFKTNLEAVDEICRQLRLRDLGGLVINDLIDMRHASNRKAVQERFAERLRRDRARSTILPISEFGILEMTRQRMRSSHEQTHFAVCPMCRGRGVVRRPDSVAAEALRELAVLCGYARVARVEMVVSGAVATHLLSGRRKQLSRIERQTGVIAEVRVSDAMAVERFVLHAYDEAGSDINLEKLPKLPDPETLLEEVEGLADSDTPLAEMQARPDADDAHDDADDGHPEPEAHPIELDVDFDEEDEDERDGPRRRRRRRRRRRGGGGEDAAEPRERAADAEPRDVDDADEARGSEDEEDEDRPRRRRRRRRRRGSDRPSEVNGDRASADEERDEDAGSLARRLASALRDDDAEEDEDRDEPVAVSEDGEEDEDRPRRRRRRRGGRRRSRGRQEAEGESSIEDTLDDEASVEQIEDEAVEDEPIDELVVDEVDDPEASDDEDSDEEPEVEVQSAAGLIEPRPARASGGSRPRFLYAAHRRTKGGPPAPPEREG
ncbi:MAG: Rne/Rng family ribonuclease [Planctomycetota bacterium]